jgi:hypothetical protein
MDLKLTDYDLDMEAGDLSFVTGAAAVAQHLAMRLRTWLAETPYDQTAGVPYLQVIFAQKAPDLNMIRLVLEGVGIRTPGMLTLEIDDPVLDMTTTPNTLTVTGRGTCTDGAIDFTEIIEVTL